MLYCWPLSCDRQPFSGSPSWNFCPLRIKSKIMCTLVHEAERMAMYSGSSCLFVCVYKIVCECGRASSSQYFTLFFLFLNFQCILLTPVNFCEQEYVTFPHLNKWKWQDKYTSCTTSAFVELLPINAIVNCLCWESTLARGELRWLYTKCTFWDEPTSMPVKHGWIFSGRCLPCGGTREKEILSSFSTNFTSRTGDIALQCSENEFFPLLKKKQTSWKSFL